MMDLTDLISGGNPYPAQNLPDATPMDPGSDPISALRALLQQKFGGGGDNTQAMSFAPTAPAAPSVPMPQPRPPMADAQPDASPAPGAPLSPDVADANAQAPQSGILSAIGGRQGVNRILASLGSGLSNVQGNSGGAAFAQGMGGALKGGQQADKDSFNQQVQALDRLQKAKEAGNNEAYKAALTDYYKALTTAKAAGKGGGDDSTPQSAVWSDPRARYDKALRAVERSNNAIDNDLTLNPQQRAERKANATSTIYQNYGLNPDGSAPASPAKTSAAKPMKKAGNPDEINIDGDGTQTVPYKPQSKDDYDQIESGTYYINPSDNTLRLKK